MVPAKHFFLVFSINIVIFVTFARSFFTQTTRDIRLRLAGRMKILYKYNIYINIIISSSIFLTLCNKRLRDFAEQVLQYRTAIFCWQNKYLLIILNTIIVCRQ